MAFGELGIQLQGLARMSFHPGYGLPRWKEAKVRERNVTEGQGGVRQSEAGVLLDRLLQVAHALEQNGLHVVDPPAVEEVAAPQVEVVGLGVDVGRLREARLLGRGQLHPDAVGDGAGDLGLQREHVAGRPFETPGPEMLIARTVDDLGADPHAAPAPENRAFHDPVDPQLPGDLGQGLGAVLVPDHGLPRDDAKRTDPRQLRDQRVGDAVGQVLLLRDRRTGCRRGARPGSGWGRRTADGSARPARRQPRRAAARATPGRRRPSAARPGWEPSPGTEGVGAGAIGGTVSTGAMKRYPWRPTVSTNRGRSAASPSAARTRLTALLRLLSKSTKVSDGQSRPHSSSRVTSSPGRSRSAARRRNGLSWSFTLAPALCSSPARTSSSKVAKRTTGGGTGVPISGPPAKEGGA